MVSYYSGNKTEIPLSREMQTRHNLNRQAEQTSRHHWRAMPYLTNFTALIETTICLTTPPWGNNSDHNCTRRSNTEHCRSDQTLHHSTGRNRTPLPNTHHCP